METPQAVISSLTHDPGVYLYKDTTGTVIYVGKAKDLKRRVRQYFAPDIEPGTKTAQLVARIHAIETLKTHSEFDALILEANLIRKFNPKYNIIAKDDKSPLYLSITLDEELPRVQFTRKSSIGLHPKRRIFGPFQSGRTLRQLLQQLRMIIPYCTQKKRDGTPCFYTHLHLCDPCPSQIAGMTDGPMRQKLITQYRTQIRRLAKILSGESLTIFHDLQKDMKTYAQHNQFEKAQAVKMSLERFSILLQTHYDPLFYTQGDTFLENVYESEMNELRTLLQPFYPTLGELHRIECIDISNTYGTFATGSLVVLIDGKSSTSDYRRFRIRTKDAPNDFAMIAEVVKRRMNHTEWPMPELLVIDGGKGQVHAARACCTVPVIGLAKRFEEIIIPMKNEFKILRLPVSSRALHALERVRDESHRFALRYHRLLRKKSFLV